MRQYLFGIYSKLSYHYHPKQLGSLGPLESEEIKQLPNVRNTPMVGFFSYGGRDGQISIL